MPVAAPHSAAQQRAAEAEEHNEAAMPLPREVVGLVAAWLPRSDWPAFRLASKQLEAALAPHITSLCAPRLPSHTSGGRLRVRPGLRHVATLGVPAAAGAAAWRALQQATAGLPQLRHLRVGSMSDNVSGGVPSSVAASWADSITWLELWSAGDPLLAGVQLRALRVLRMDGSARIELSSIAAFAPRLEQLLCSGLSLAASDAAVLGALTHLDALVIDVAGVASKAEGLAALVRTLPHVSVLVRDPIVIDARNPWEASRGDEWEASLDDVLAALPAVTAVRCYVADELRHLSASSAQRIEHLAVYERPWASRHKQVPPQALRHMSRLASLSLVPVHNGATSFVGPQLLQVLASLPALQRLVLPATVLCDVCCPGAHAALPGLAGSTSLVSLEFVAAYGASRDQRLFCDHADSRAAGAGVVRAAAAARGVALQRLRLQKDVQSSMAASPDFFEQVAAGARRGDSVWGAFGPTRGQV